MDGMPHLSEVIRNVEKYSIEDVVRAAEKSLEPCDCEDPDVVEVHVMDQVEPIKRFCALCYRDMA